MNWKHSQSWRIDMDFNKYYEDRQKLVNTFLEKRLEKKGISRVDEAMAYSLLAGGKRIRPIILMATADALGVSGYNFLPVACGLEMIHTYSLIHDDLPCMDDDEYRRGRLTNHKVFGEALALLAGDALLTLAFEVMLEQKNVPAEALIETVREVAMCAGNFGMVGGQVIDLDSEGRQISEEELRKLHAGKTGALFIAAVRSGARLSGAASDEPLALSAKLLLNGTLNCQSILAYPLSDSCALAGMAKAMAMAASATTLKYIFFLVFITVVVVYLLVR